METDDTIHRARQGDESAWRKLMHKHQHVIFRLAYLILGDPDEADDVAQETFIRAHDSFESFEAEKPLRPWLYRIAANLAYNHRRSIGRRWEALKRFGRVKPDKEENPEKLSIKQIQAQNLREAVTQLKRTDQMVIYYYYFLGLSVDETAHVLEVAPGTVKSRLHRARNRLQGLIKREYPFLLEKDIRNE